VSYFRADTSNNQGWRPGTVQLGYMSSGRRNGPDWKTVAAQHDAAIHSHRRRQRGLEQAIMARMNAVDAAARGDRTPVRVAQLSGLGALSSAAEMVRGAQYTFHFAISSSFWGGNIDANSLRVTIARDTNFSGVSVAQETGGFQVNFTYTGIRASVAGASNEMQQIIHDAFFNGLGLTGSANFVWAEGGPLLTTDANGNSVVATDAAGNVLSAGTSSPGDNSADPNSTFDLGTFISGLGVGGAAAVALGVLLVMKS